MRIRIRMQEGDFRGSPLLRTVPHRNHLGKACNTPHESRVRFLNKPMIHMASSAFFALVKSQLFYHDFSRIFDTISNTKTTMYRLYTIRYIFCCFTSKCVLLLICTIYILYGTERGIGWLEYLMKN